MTESTTPIETTDNRSNDSRKRKIIIGGATVLAAAGLFAGGIALGTNIDFDDDNDNDTSETAATATDSDDTNDTPDTLDADVATATGASSPAELVEIIEKASAEAEGAPISIEAAADNAWEVQFVESSGAESEVLVSADGTAKLTSTEAAERGETAPSGKLDAATIESLMTAATASQQGTVLSVEIDSDTTSPYDVTVLTADKKTVDVALDTSFAVVTSGN